MKEKQIQFLGIVLTVIYAFFIGWLYWAEPRSLEDVSIKARETVESASTKGQIIIGTYEVDKALFEQGLAAFRQDNFTAARDAFLRADPERRDAKTQFYIAYSYYRQGFGRVFNDDELFRQGLKELDRVVTIDRNFKSDDPDLQMKTPAELRGELEEGLELSAKDLNPFKVFRERK